MSEKSKIEWTDSSWNCTTGCTQISEGCRNCYAKALAKRLMKIGNKRYANGFKVTLHPDALNLPLKWKKPRKIFVNSMSDLFHKEIPSEFIDRVWEVMVKADWHIYQILTKRPNRMYEYVEFRRSYDYPHIWLGVTVENAETKDRIDILRKTSAGLRFISFEPLIGDVGKLDLSGIGWCIAGGESGPNHRPMKEEWILNILKQCREQKVPFFFKQWGGITPKSGGRLLQGKEYNEYPTKVS